MSILRADFKHGITLIELIIVVVIVGILATISIANYSKQIEKSRGSEAQSNLQSIWTAERVYRIRTGSYTTNWTDLNIDNPNNPSGRFYDYTINTATDTSLLVTATRRTKSSLYFTINQDGLITQFGTY